MSAAWAAYVAQYSNLLNQAGAQPAGANLPHAGQNIIESANIPQVTQLDQQQPATQQPVQDYTEQWIEYYIMNGRPDYAEQIIELKKQQQAQQKQS